MENFGECTFRENRHRNLNLLSLDNNSADSASNDPETLFKTLDNYILHNIVPRGLRIFKHPAFELDEVEHATEWDEALHECSIKLIKILVKYREQRLEKNKIEIKNIIQNIQGYKNEEKWINRNASIQSRIKKLDVELQAKKHKKLLRDMEDFKENKVYSYKQEANEARLAKQTNKVSGNTTYTLTNTNNIDHAQYVEESRSNFSHYNQPGIANNNQNNYRQSQHYNESNFRRNYQFRDQNMRINSPVYNRRQSFRPRFSSNQKDSPTNWRRNSNSQFFRNEPPNPRGFYSTRDQDSDWHHVPISNRFEPLYNHHTRNGNWEKTGAKPKTNAVVNNQQHFLDHRENPKEPDLIVPPNHAQSQIRSGKRPLEIDVEQELGEEYRHLERRRKN
ncbi:GATA zinc finger domain-containing protein 14-like [Bombina bombina]|uniref:GATA zinc finger domain-containing protein 14-like n=1 Tax=Bombina bombina TaxID=8345 RepID=UPI00235B15DC|nr:GATA zinc finger domain-containing protein 14-like [Bombina bombina]